MKKTCRPNSNMAMNEKLNQWLSKNGEGAKRKFNGFNRSFKKADPKKP